jgi:hypothetical protein
MNKQNDTTDWEYEQEKAKEARRAKVEEAIETIFAALNRMGNEKEVGEFVIDNIRTQHRTLQQNFFGQVIKPVILDFADRYNEDLYDDRNAAACECASKLKGILAESYFPFI